MSVSLSPSVRSTSPDSTLRAVGALGLVTGILGAAGAVLLLAWSPQVPADLMSYPFTQRGFAIVQSVFAVQHLPLALLIAALWRSGAVGRSRLGAAGVALGVVGMLGLAAMELWIIHLGPQAYPGDATSSVDPGYGVTSMTIGLGLVLAGIAVLRAHAWAGPERWLALALGIFVFVPMGPGIAAGFVPARIVIGLWMLMFGALGWVLMRRAD